MAQSRARAEGTTQDGSGVTVVTHRRGAEEAVPYQARAKAVYGDATTAKVRAQYGPGAEVVAQVQDGATVTS